MRLVRSLQPAGLALTSGLLAALLANAVLPSALALVLGSIVSRVVVPRSLVLSAMLLPLVFFGGVLAFGQLAEAIILPVEYLFVSRIDGAHRARLSQMIAAVPTIEVLEQPAVQVMIHEVQADARHGFESTPGQGAAAQLRWLTGLTGIVFSGSILARYSWWLPFVVILPAALNSLLRYRRTSSSLASCKRRWQANSMQMSGARPPSRPGLPGKRVCLG
jgi:ATP-binding cassette subfamily B protein